jgi:two-component system, OmpR family, phosphate regulon sensor histidine kinase PhoR
MKSIRWRIAIPFILLAVFSIGSLAWYSSIQLQQEYQKAEQERLLNEAHLAADQVTPLFNNADAAAIETEVNNYAKLLSVRVTLIRPDGVVIGDSSSDPSTMENHLNRPEIIAALGGRDGLDTRLSATLSKMMVYAAVPVKSSGSVIGAVRLAIPLADISTELQSFNRTLLLVTIGIILVIMVLAFYISEYTAKPIQQLTAAANQIGARQFVSGKILDRKDEMGVLSRAFNEMSENLSREFTQLETEQEKLYAVLSSMSDGVIITDEEGSVQLLNPTASRLFNIQEHQAIGHSLTEVIRHHQLVDLWKKSTSMGEQQSMTLDLGAEKLYLQVVVTPMGGAMQDATLLLFQDFTRQRKLETIRQDFISNVSHELRTPLAAVKSLTETLQEGAMEDPEAARRCLSMMDREIDTMSQIVQELLELSRIESGRAPLQKRTTSIQEMMQPAVERMRLQAVRAGLSLTLDIPEGLPEINVDVDRIQQVMMNLLHNAVKFTPPGGTIEVSTRQVDEFIQVAIKDSGVGIQSNDLPRIFERFYKADRARSGGGTGLGLSVARHIVEAHGGQIWAESQVGEGSTFFFTLPIN